MKPDIIAIRFELPCPLCGRPADCGGRLNYEARLARHCDDCTAEMVRDLDRLRSSSDPLWELLGGASGAEVNDGGLRGTKS